MIRIGDIPVGGGAPLVLIAGLNVIESEAGTLDAARTLQLMASRHDFPLVFKASVDKANRSSLRSYRGPGFDEGLAILGRVKAETGLPLLTDVHEPGQAKPVSEVVDCLQIPAFLCRQTDLIVACAATGRPVNIKKGQFISPEDARLAVEKVADAGSGGALLTERGSSFGYNDGRGHARPRAHAQLRTGLLRCHALRAAAGRRRRCQRRRAQHGGAARARRGGRGHRRVVRRDASRSRRSAL
jgi:2-dehydro-3-deoxyphosphooctonate aldolase (KDO 8-P synthase)